MPPPALLETGEPVRAVGVARKRRHTQSLVTPVTAHRVHRSQLRPLRPGAMPRRYRRLVRLRVDRVMNEPGAGGRETNVPVQMKRSRWDRLTLAVSRWVGMLL